MATSASNPALAKQLKEHLREQQEPFKLSTYLFEKRNSLKKLSSNGEDSSCSLSKCSSDLRETCTSSLRKKRVLHYPKSLKSLLYKLITSNEKQEPSACNNKAVKDKLVSETIYMIQHIAETNWFSTASNADSFSADFDYGDQSLVAETSQALNAKHSKEEKTDTDMQRKWGYKEGDKELILGTVSQDLATGASNSWIISSQANGEPLFSAYLLKPLLKSLAEKHIQARITRAMQRVDSGKLNRVLPPSKRLLFDCMKKTVVNNVRNYRRQTHLHKFLSLEELGSIISRQLFSMGKQLVNATNAAHMINLDFSSTAEEWNYFRHTKWQICREMGESIIDEIINEIIDLQ